MVVCILYRKYREYMYLKPQKLNGLLFDEER